ncbi:MAG TPA: tetratricopeptide repeat protein [Ramlibacter sp.]
MTRVIPLACLWLVLATAIAAPPDERAPGLEVRLQQATVDLDRLRGALDPRLYADAARRVQSLADQAPQHPRVLALQAWLAMTAHGFAEALALADRALAHDPREPVALALRTDALTELGRYPEAIDAAEALDSAVVGPPAVLRIAHLRRLHGDLEGAVELVDQVVRRHPASDRDHAWLVRELAALHWHGGRDAPALALLEALPQDDREALMLRARIVETGGRTAEAHALWAQAGELTPLPAALLGQWRTAGDAAERRRLSHRLAGMARLDEGQSGVARRDFVEFFARSGRLDEAMRLARLEYRRRPDVFGAAQLAWVLALAGERDAAAAHAGEATRLGTIDRELAAHVAAAGGGKVAADGRQGQ